MRPETRGPVALVAFLILSAILVTTASAAGMYLHTTTDPAYWDSDTQTVIQDPYGVGEGEGASNEGNHVAYEGVVEGGDDHYVLEKAGWPYDRTRVVLTAAFPCIPDRFCFDHDAAAQLLAAGMGWPTLHALYEKR